MGILGPVASLGQTLWAERGGCVDTLLARQIGKAGILFLSCWVPLSGLSQADHWNLDFRNQGQDTGVSVFPGADQEAGTFQSQRTPLQLALL